jgi:hypothetical protein
VWLEEEAELEKERLRSERKKLPKGYAGHLVALCKQLREAAGSNPTARSLVEGVSAFIQTTASSLFCGFSWKRK